MERRVDRYPCLTGVVHVGVDCKHGLLIVQQPRPWHNAEYLGSEHFGESEIDAIARNRAKVLTSPCIDAICLAQPQNLLQFPINAAVFVKEVPVAARKRAKFA